MSFIGQTNLPIPFFNFCIHFFWAQGYSLFIILNLVLKTFSVNAESKKKWRTDCCSWMQVQITGPFSWPKGRGPSSGRDTRAVLPCWDPPRLQLAFSGIHTFRTCPVPANNNKSRGSLMSRKPNIDIDTGSCRFPTSLSHTPPRPLLSWNPAAPYSLSHGVVKLSISTLNYKS